MLHKALNTNFKIFALQIKEKMAMNFAPVALVTCPYMRSGATSLMNCARIAVWNYRTYKHIKMNTLQRDINALLNDMAYEHPRYEIISDFFEMSAIAIRNAVSYDSQRAEYEKRYADVAKKYNGKQIKAFSMALARFQDEITLAINGGAPFRDWAGELYMESDTYNANFGQSFTPYALSKMTAMVGTGIDTIKAKIAEDSNYIMTIQEPTVGAGGLIVAAMEFLRSNGINYSWNCFVDCGDIDARCFFMTYLTLSLLGFPPWCVWAMR